MLFLLGTRERFGLRIPQSEEKPFLYLLSVWKEGTFMKINPWRLCPWRELWAPADSVRCPETGPPRAQKNVRKQIEPKKIEKDFYRLGRMKSQLGQFETTLVVPSMKSFWKTLKKQKLEGSISTQQHNFTIILYIYPQVDEQENGYESYFGTWIL